MSLPVIQHCPGTLAEGYSTYSPSCLKRVFENKKVSHILPYDSPIANQAAEELFLDHRKRLSISGVQEKFSVLQEKNKLRLVDQGEKGTFILKPIPGTGNIADQMPANEHLTMQIARQVYDIETAENAMIFFSNGDPAYITRRFDVKQDGSKLAMEDFASLAGRTPQTDGEHYKYLGNYSDLFTLLKKNVPAYQIEALKLYKIIFFNFLFSNGDAHFKNFSLLETDQGDFKLAPAYDLLNTRMHMDEDSSFALVDGLLPINKAQGKIFEQLQILSEMAGINQTQRDNIIKKMLANENQVTALINASFLNEKTKKEYLQAFQTRRSMLLFFPQK